MSNLFRYGSLAAQATIVALFFYNAFHGYIHVIREVTMHGIQMGENGGSFYVDVVHGIVSLYVDQMAFHLTPYFLRLCGITSRKTYFVYPVVHFAIGSVSWYRGRLPSYMLLFQLQSIIYVQMLVIKDKEKKSTPSPSTHISDNQIIQQVFDILLAYYYFRMETPRSIRLISLQPSKSFDHPLECELSEVELDHAPEYTALSYSWDSSEGTATILCDGGFLKVTKNCARALHRIRQREGSQDLNLWVDAICIDQGTDPEAVSERTQQIQIMGEIYKRASNVIAYVGEHDYAHGSKHVCEFFESVGRSLEIDDSILKKVRLWPRFTEFFREFFQRSWFTRMWPIQEVTLPRRGSVTLLCGDSSIPFEYIRIGWQALMDVDLLIGSFRLDQAVALQFYLADALALKRGDDQHCMVRKFGRPLIADLSELSLTKIMQATRFKACFLAKDKFFALLGIFQELGIAHKVDISRYAELTEAEAYLGVFESCLAFDKSLDVLLLAQSPEKYISSDDFWTTRADIYDGVSSSMTGMIGKLSTLASRRVIDDRPEWRANLPSWVPDWTQCTRSDADDWNIKLINQNCMLSLGVYHIPWKILKSKSRFSTSGPTETNPAPKANQSSSKVFRGLFYFSYRTRPSNTKYPPRLCVRGKVVGTIQSIGTVGSFDALWQLLSAMANSYNWFRYWTAYEQGLPTPDKDPFFRSIPDAFNATLIENARNYVVDTVLSQVLMSLRMVFWAFDAWNITRVATSLLAASCFQHESKWLMCALSIHAASPCSGNDLIPSVLTLCGIALDVFSIVLSVKEQHSTTNSFYQQIKDRLSRAASAMIPLGAIMVWQYRVPLYTTMYSLSYEHDLFHEVFSLWMVGNFALFTACLFKDEVSIHLSRVVTILSGLVIAFETAWWTSLRHLTSITLLTFGVTSLRCVRGTLYEIWGSEMFKRRGTFTPGLHFFSTNSGITGNTGGPVQLHDVLVVVDRAREPVVMRRQGKMFEIVGSAYVGNKTKEELEGPNGAWELIRIK